MDPILRRSMAIFLMSAVAASASADKEAPETYRQSPVSVWVTGYAGRFGAPYAAGGSLQMAVSQGWAIGFDALGGEEMCIFCGRVAESFYAFAGQFGYRAVNSTGYGYIGAGPSWGSGERSGGKVPDTTCGPPEPGGLFCDEVEAPAKTYEGYGIQVKAQGALSWRYLGLGAQFQIQFIPGHAIAGVSLFLPIGLIK